MTALSSLTAATSLAASDLLYAVVSGNSRKITWANVLADMAAETQTLTNKTISGASNTLSAIALASLAAGVQASLALADSAQQPPSEGAFVNGDKTKLDGIEAGADVTDTANVTAAGALMDSEVANLAAVKAFDPADYATAAQGALADTALQSVTGTTGQITVTGSTLALASAVLASLALADSAVQPGDDAATLGSGAATDGYVLTADGLGGAAWEAAAGGATAPLTLASGTLTASDPALTITQTWNNAAVTFTGITADITDTASASASLLADLKTGGVTRLSVAKNGDLTLKGTSSVGAIIDSTAEFRTGRIIIGQGILGGSGGVGAGATGTIYGGISSVGMGVSSGLAIGFTSSTVSAALDTTLNRDAAGTLALRRGTNVQTFRVYETESSSLTNYARLAFNTTAGDYTIATEAAGTGTRRNLVLNGANRAAKINDVSGTPSGTDAAIIADLQSRVAAIIDALESHGLSATS